MIDMLEKGCEDVDELVDHQEVPHGLYYIVVPANRQHHVVDPLLEHRNNDADHEQTHQVQVPQQLQQRVFGQQLADRHDDRGLSLCPDLRAVKDDG